MTWRETILIVVAGTLLLLILSFTGARAPVRTETVSTPSSTPASSDSDKTVVYRCTDGRSITATFHLPSDSSVDVKLSDGRSFSLPHAISASGARYANSDESLVFWNKGDTAFILENGKTTYLDCSLPAQP